MTALLEYLPDEILLVVCGYLSQKQILRAFCGLNSRLNCTISQFLQSLLIVDDKYEIGEPSRRLLSTIGPYLHSLAIRQTRLTAAEISLASNIQELTFIHTPPDPIPPLANLTDLNIIDGPSFQSVNTLFCKTNDLHSVYITSTDALTIPLFSPPKYSTVEQLAIALKSTKDFLRLLDACPELTCLNLTLHDCCFNDPLSIESHSNLRIFSLRTSYKLIVNFQQLKTLFQCLTPKLEHLSIEMETDDKTCLDGRIWETCLREHFPELNCLEFFILFREVAPSSSQPVRVPDVLETFRNAYWSSIVSQNVTGYYNRNYAGESTCVHTHPIPRVQRRRHFLY